MKSEKHIILIDDDPIIHVSCEMILFGSGYRKTSIIDPEEAIRYQSSKDKYDKPDLLMIDLMIGTLSGIDVIQSIRSDVYFDNIPIILYTGYCEKIISNHELLKKLKISSVLSKILLKEQLLSKVRDLIGS